ncbi:MAG: exodeoxyribonuclease VII large subunit [Desulfatibacillaceae bacterium]
MDLPHKPLERRIHTVSELTARIKDLVESAFPFAWVSGEISNLRHPGSGHLYFTLKDADAQLRAVMFKGQARAARFSPEDGMSVICLGRIAVYEPQGVYQIIAEYLEPAGVGALQVAFEQLKAKLGEEGLFDPTRKRPLPFLPARITLITSPTGAVVHDILHVLDRRFPDVHVRILPVKVQGENAPEQIVEALDTVGRMEDCDVVVIARGGGSLEDLSSFNTEPVARAIFNCPIPVVSAVGHETDYTIADFVADVRAPTPSAAAEIIVPERMALTSAVRDLVRRLAAEMEQAVKQRRRRVSELSGRLADPKRRIQESRLRVDELAMRLDAAMRREIRQRRDRAYWLDTRLNNFKPLVIISKRKSEVEALRASLVRSMGRMTDKKRSRLAAGTGRLTALSPLSVLERGYSITRIVDEQGEKRVVTTSDQTDVGSRLEILLRRGSLAARVEERTDDGEDAV